MDLKGKKVTRMVFEVLFPILISCIIAMHYSWNWIYMLMLYILLSGIIHFLFFRNYKSEIRESTQKKFIIVSITFLQSSIITIILGIVLESKIILILGIAIFSIGVGLQLGKCAENIINKIMNSLQ